MLMKSTITCFGEILWDVLPTSKQAGGAPMNVAANLRNFGLNAQLVSRVGNDVQGWELLNFLSKRGILIDLVQTDNTHSTGAAVANLSIANEVSYTIVQPAAWDYIYLDPFQINLVEESDFFVYGSLAARSPQTYETLQTLLSVARRKVFDVNLRSPHYTPEVVSSLLREAHIAKLNENELAEITSWYNGPKDTEKAMMTLYDEFNLETLCVTFGEKGAVLLNDGGFYQQTGFPVDVVDTIGSGDAFLAAFLYQIRQHSSPQDVLAFSCATGAYVATQHGATPSFSETDIATFLAMNRSPTDISLLGKG